MRKWLTWQVRHSLLTGVPYPFLYYYWIPTPYTSVDFCQTSTFAQCQCWHSGALYTNIYFGVLVVKRELRPSHMLYTHYTTESHPDSNISAFGTDWQRTFKVLHFKHLIFFLTARAGILSDLKDPHIKGLVTRLWCWWALKSLGGEDMEKLRSLEAYPKGGEQGLRVCFLAVKIWTNLLITLKSAQPHVLASIRCASKVKRNRAKWVLAEIYDS